MKLALLSFLALAACGARSELDAPLSTSLTSTDGATPCVDEVIASDSIGSQVLAVDGDVVFWASENGKQYRHDASGTTELCSGCDTLSIAVDDTYVYGAAGDRVSLVPRAGGAVSYIDAPGVSAIARRGDALLYLTATSLVSLFPAAAPTTRTTIAIGLEQPEYFDVDDDNAYVSSRAGIGRASLRGSSQTPTILATPSSIGPVKAYAGDVYFVDDLASNGGGVFKVPASGGPVTPMHDIGGTTKTAESGTIAMRTERCNASLDASCASIRRTRAWGCWMRSGIRVRAGDGRGRQRSCDLRGLGGCRRR